MTPALVTLAGAGKSFDTGSGVWRLLSKRRVQAVSDVTLELRAGEILAAVGESGCGKSTLGRMAAGILKPSAGRVLYDGRDFAALTGAARIRAKLGVQMVFQDPFGSLNPRMRVGAAIAQAPRAHRVVEPARIDAHLESLLRRCGLDPALARRYPHQLSGGQRQRVGIARALAVAPKALVCDEAVAALDVSIQAQILNLLLDLRDGEGLGLLFITHDIGVVERIADRIAVMYLGRVVESGPAGDVLAAPAHPYTIALEREVPRLNRRGRASRPIEGELPSPLDPPPGCAFHPRCPEAVARCRAERPVLRDLGGGRAAACHLLDGAPAPRTDGGRT